MDTLETPNGPARDLGRGRRVVIAGAGLAGSLLACSLGRMGFRVTVLERRPDPRRAGYAGGRSINLALSVRGIRALTRLGLAERVLAHAIPMPGRMLHDRHGGLAFQAYSKDPRDAINSVSRGGLNLVLIEQAALDPNVQLAFDQRCIDVDVGAGAPAAIVEDATRPPGQSPTRRVEGDLVLGADGAFSAVRARLQKNDRFEYEQSYLSHGYKELHIPARADASFAMEPHALHIWPRRRAMMIALPNPDKTFTCTLFWPWEGEHSFERVRGRATVESFFREHYPDAVPLMPTLAEDFERNPASSLVTVRCWPWRHEDRVLVLGDAAHAIVPFFGQGMNCAFEDCAALCEMLEAQDGDLSRVLPAFERARKPHAEAIADMALENFVEMRDKVGSRAFRLKKKGEHLLHALLPGTYVPLYHMVSFTSIPYADARARARRQSGIVRAVAIAIGLALSLALLAWAWASRARGTS